MALSAPGLGSNLDVNSIVGQLMAVEKRPLIALDRKEASYQAQLSAYGSLKASLASFQTALAGMTTATRLQGMTASVADTTIATASGSAGAVAGSYLLQVTQLAQAQSLVSVGQSSTSAPIGSGATTTLTFQFGTISGGTLSNGEYSGASFAQDASQASGTVTIDGTNNSLEGIRNAINAANIGVTATIVNDGSASPNRFVLSSNATGARSSMKIMVSGDADIQSLLAYDPAATQNLTQTAAAQNASLAVNGLAISSASNKLTAAIQGVIVNLQKTGSTTLTVSQDIGTVGAAVTSFVNAYNEVHKLIAKLTAYDPSAKSGGTLLGDATTRTVQGQLRTTLTTALTGLTGKFTHLTQIGVSFQKDGTLGFDNAKLQQAFSSGFSDIAALFAADGKATDSLISYSSATSATRPGSYALEVTSLATRGTATGSVALGGATTITSGANDELVIVIDGVSATVKLSQGTYSPTELAAQLQSAINGTSAFSSAGIGASVAVSGSNELIVTSNRYGAASTVNVSGGSAQADIFGAPASTAAGLDASGRIGGVAAIGSGQYLTAASGTSAEGLKIQVLGGATGTRGSLSYSQGYAYRLNALIDNLLGVNGPLASRTDGVNRSVKDLGRQRDALNLRLADVEKRYRAQFTALDKMVGSMQQMSTFLQQQLANLPKTQP